METDAVSKPNIVFSSSFFLEHRTMDKVHNPVSPSIST
jgi:hypothetical protein